MSSTVSHALNGPARHSTAMTNPNRPSQAGSARVVTDTRHTANRQQDGRGDHGGDEPGVGHVHQQHGHHRRPRPHPERLRVVGGDRVDGPGDRHDHDEHDERGPADEHQVGPGPGETGERGPEPEEEEEQVAAGITRVMASVRSRLPPSR